MPHRARSYSSDITLVKREEDERSSISTVSLQGNGELEQEPRQRVVKRECEDEQSTSVKRRRENDNSVAIKHEDHQSNEEHDGAKFLKKEERSGSHSAGGSSTLVKNEHDDRTAPLAAEADVKPPVQRVTRNVFYDPTIARQFADPAVHAIPNPWSIYSEERDTFTQYSTVSYVRRLLSQAQLKCVLQSHQRGPSLADNDRVLHESRFLFGHLQGIRDRLDRHIMWFTTVVVVKDLLSKDDWIRMQQDWKYLREAIQKLYMFTPYMRDELCFVADRIRACAFRDIEDP